MIALDTNILIQAHRTELAHHVPARLRLQSLVLAGPFGLPVFCLAEFVCVVTHPRIFKPATTLETALSRLTELTTAPNCLVLGPGPRFASLFARACSDAAATGNLVFDAQIVAVCREHGVHEILTLDRDFARFPGIRAVGLGGDS
ncbi:MAG: TA system VapC family ribonuclease toxin [Acidobacteriota bacterium]